MGGDEERCDEVWEAGARWESQSIPFTEAGFGRERAAGFGGLIHSGVIGGGFHETN